MTPEDAQLIEAFGHGQRRRNFSARTIYCRACVLANLAEHSPDLLGVTRADIESFLDDHGMPEAGHVFLDDAGQAHRRRRAGAGARVCLDPTTAIERPRLPKPARPGPRAPGQIHLPRPSREGRRARGDGRARWRPSSTCSRRRPAISDTLRRRRRCFASSRARGRRRPADAGLAAPGGSGGLLHAFYRWATRAELVELRGVRAERALIRHASVQTTMGYVELCPDEAAAAVVCGL